MNKKCKTCNKAQWEKQSKVQCFQQKTWIEVYKKLAYKVQVRIMLTTPISKQNIDNISAD